MGLAAGLCWRRTVRSSWSGHQSLFVRGRWSAGWGDGISGFSLSLGVLGASLSGTDVPLLVAVFLWQVLVRGGRAGGAASPVDDLGLVDLVAPRVRRDQAGCLADRAVHVDDRAARPADEVVVVVPHPRLVAGHRAGRLDPPHEPGVGQGAQYVVDGLMRHVRGPPDGAEDRLG